QNYKKPLKNVCFSGVIFISSQRVNTISPDGVSATSPSGVKYTRLFQLAHGRVYAMVCTIYNQSKKSTAITALSFFW
ncbi:MAG: hypothetical protein IKP91_07130, partial [Bacteroidaceae bacterium]|nr:hypothetical protein [Bacteroidaceae bacterium]